MVENVTADWHAHDESDELFQVLSGVVNIDTEEDSQAPSAGELLIVPACTMHRARVEGRYADRDRCRSRDSVQACNAVLREAGA